jgi:hemoglobin
LAGEQIDTGGDPAPTYDRIGGSAIRETVERFDARELDDPELQPSFRGSNVAEIKRHQVLLLSQELGGRAGYAGRELADAHGGLGTTGDHDHRVVGHLVARFTDLGAEPDTIAAAGDVLVGVRPDVGESATSP